MKNLIRFVNLLIIILVLCFSGCLKDKITPPAEIPINQTGKLLFFLEDEGDYINSEETPSLVDAEDVYNNLQTYLLVDIRPDLEFSSGHIEGASNVPHSNLISFLDSLNSEQFSKVIIISKNGQSSAFYTCLLRLYGFGNTFSLSYGMASWNSVFSDEWFNALQENYSLFENFTAVFSETNSFYALPEISLSDSSLESGVKVRIKALIKLNYEDDLGSGESAATIEFAALAANIYNYFIVCYDEGLLYKDHYDGIFHPDGSFWFRPPPASDLSSSRFLQTLPPDRKIAFYTTNGELSAFVVAYLRVLGYDAKSVLFGANNMFYNTLSNVNGLNQDAFSSAKIKNYTYVTGN